MSNFFASIASFSFVPTPSVPDKITGFLYPLGNSKAPANEPIPPRTPGIVVAFT